jgi:antitoxin component YwqK of YwqJK toxin-antitoxin module
MSNNQFEFIKKNNERCKRLINNNTKYCWQHIDSDISESLESGELLKTLPAELIQYVLNPYIDYVNESQLIQNLTGVKLDINPHLTYITKYYDSDKTVIKSRKTYLDLKLIKYESWYPNTNKEYIYNFKNGKLEVIKESWYPNGNKESISNFKNGKIEGIKESWYPNGNKMYIENYKNGELEGEFKYWYPNGNKEYI